MPYFDLVDTQGAYINGYMGAEPPVRTCIPSLDDSLSGGFRPGLHVMGAPPGAGKTAIALYMSLLMAMDGTPTVYYSMEVPGDDCRARLDSLLSKELDLKEFRWADRTALGSRYGEMESVGRYDSSQDRIYMADIELVRLCGNTLKIIDATPDMGCSNLPEIEQQIAWAGSAGVKVFFIDYLQCIDSDDCADPTVRMGPVARELNQAGRKHGMAVIALSAVSRTAGKDMRTGKPIGSDIFRDSSWIEYTAQTASALIRTDGEDGKPQPKVTLQIVKNRFGPVGDDIEFGYDGAHNSFTFKASGAEGRDSVDVCIPQELLDAHGWAA